MAVAWRTVERRRSSSNIDRYREDSREAGGGFDGSWQGGVGPAGAGGASAGGVERGQPLWSREAGGHMGGSAPHQVVGGGVGGERGAAGHAEHGAAGDWKPWSRNARGSRDGQAGGGYGWK
jgi:hypothetical protein